MSSAYILRGDARRLPLPDASVDLICTSPPFYALRSYTDTPQLCDRCRQISDGFLNPGDANRNLREAWPDWDAHVAAEHKPAHYDGQIGAEPTPREYIDNLIACTREWVRVLKPTGSLFVNLGDCYSGKAAGPQGKNGQRADRASAGEPYRAAKWGTSTDGDAAQWTQANAAWLAGVLDCEGSVSVRAFKTESGTTSFVAWMRVGMMDPQVCARIRDITGVGRLFQDGRGVYNWNVASQQARYVLERIWPYLLIKQRQALGAIELCRHVADRRARGKWAQLTPEDVTYRLTIAEAVQTWNKRQEHPWTPPAIDPISLPHTIGDVAAKSLRGLPWRYALRCIDELGLILRAEVIWSKANGLPESVTDRVRRSHEQVFHFTAQPRYYAAVDRIRLPHIYPNDTRHLRGGRRSINPDGTPGGGNTSSCNPLGALPGSVWEVATQPFKAPTHLGVDHFAAWPMRLIRPIIDAWSPAGVCTGCGEGRRPVAAKGEHRMAGHGGNYAATPYDPNGRAYGVNHGHGASSLRTVADRTITGEACGCPAIASPTRPGVVLDPFAGTGTTMLVAKALGRTGIGVDMSSDYCRLATWRCNSPGQLAAALEVDKPRVELDGQDDLLTLLGGIA